MIDLGQGFSTSVLLIFWVREFFVVGCLATSLARKPKSKVLWRGEGSRGRYCALLTLAECDQIKCKFLELGLHPVARGELGS